MSNDWYIMIAIIAFACLVATCLTCVQYETRTDTFRRDLVKVLADEEVKAAIKAALEPTTGPHVMEVLVGANGGGPFLQMNMDGKAVGWIALGPDQVSYLRSELSKLP